MECSFCKKDRKFVIKKFEYWTFILHKNQAYLGRSLVILNRHTEDLFNITREEAKELFEIGKSARDAIFKIFKPDLVNYGALGNFVRHVHVHIIPRYAKSRLFEGKKFVDGRWGDFYYPYDKNFKTPARVTKKIVAKIKKEMNNK